MKVLLLFTFGVSLKDWFDSGLLSRELKIYKNLHRKYNVSFVFITYGSKEDLAFVNEYDFIKVIPVYEYLKKKKSVFYNIIYLFLNFNGVLKKTGVQFDLIKTNQLTGALLGVVAKIKYKKPLFVRTGYDLFLFAKKDKKNIFKQILYYLLTFFSLNYCNLYSVSSKSDFEHISKNYFYKKKKLVIRSNWVEVENYNALEKHKKNEFLSVGRLEPQKDFEYLIEYFNKTDLILNIVGDGKLRNSLESISNNNILYLGRLPHEKLLNLYKEFKFYITSSDFEGNPKSLLEAMSRGCIVVAPDIKNITEIITNGKNGILYSKDKDNLNILLQSISKENFEHISSNAFEFIKENYSLESSTEQEYEDYLNLLKN